MNQLQPSLVVVLAGQTATKVGNGSGAWLLLSPDTMHQYRLHSQQMCLVGICAPTAAAAAAATPNPSTPVAAAASPSSSRYTSPSKRSTTATTTATVLPATPSNFGPAAAPIALNPNDVIPCVDLHARAGMSVVDANNITTTNGSDTTSSSSSGSSSTSQQQQQQQPGRFLVPVTLWPCAKLARGSALLSPGAWSSLVQPGVSCCLAVYEVDKGVVVQPAVSLSLQLCVDPQEGLPLTPGNINPDISNSSSSNAGQDAAAAGSSDGALTPYRETSAAAAAGYSTPTSSSKRRPLSAAGSSKKGSSSSKKSAGSSSRGTQQQQQQQSADISSSRVDVIGQWQLRLLQEGVDWSEAKHRQLLQRLAQKQLIGRTVLPGNLIYLPVLGLQLLFKLHPQAAAAAEDSTTQQRQQQQQHQRGVEPLLITSSTQIKLLMPGEDDGHRSTAFGGSSSSSSNSQQAAAALAAATGLTAATGSSSSGRDLAAVIAAARAAAQLAVTGSSQEAAMQAAERAVRAGAAASSGGGGYSRLGGIAAYSNALKELVLLPLQLPQLFEKYKLRSPKGLLLHGPPGSGKTALARAAAVECGATLLVVNGPDVISEFYGESEAGLTGIFAATAALSPSIIFIDELDAIAPSREAQGHGGSSSHTAAAGGGSGSSAAGEAAARVLTQLLTLMDGLSSSSSSSSSGNADAESNSNASTVSSAAAGGAAGGSRVVVIGATNRPAVLDPALRRPGRFERELEVGVPDPAGREDILKVKFSQIKHNLTTDQIHRLAATTHGFVGADLAALVNEAAMGALRRYVLQQQQRVAAEQQQQQQQQGGLCVCWDDVAAARLLVKPSALREVAVEVPQLTWDDVGGLSGIKQRLQEAVLWPQQHADALSRIGAVAPKGILLYGPPGCSKTLLAKAVAATAGLNFLSVKGGELYSKYVGESERAIAALFARARAAAPAVVFFDEIDGLISQRGDAGGGGGIGERVLAQLLTELDGLQPRLGVVVLAATNRPDKVDPALLRPGRFDRLLLVPPPDAAARLEILKVHTRKTPLHSDVNLEYVASRTEGFTGADISALCREAAMSALEEDLEILSVSARHFDLALMRVKASNGPSSNTMAMYQQFQRHSSLVAA